MASGFYRGTLWRNSQHLFFWNKRGHHFVSQPMRDNQITFNTNLLDPMRTRADFIYKLNPTLISITDTGLSQRPVTEDIKAVLRKIEYWHHGSIGSFKI